MPEIPPLYDKKCQCLLCKKPFTTKKVRSRYVKVLEYDTDFNPTYASDETNPVFYYVNVCPHCGFSFTDEFAPYFPPGSKELIQEKVCKHWVPHDFGGNRTIQEAIKTYKLSVYCATLKKEKHIFIAGLYMRLAWLYRRLKNNDQENRFMKLACQEYMESYMEDDFKGTQVSDVRILYLIGDLSRRMSDFDQAVKYFSKVIEKQNQTVESKIVEMAKERWYEIRDTKKAEKEPI
ncbi:DUF2225 domain-containing protein [Bacillus massilinigeriensis]|uniref:DUF2225 domain-containing protein n=1 Tax=Bacillus massilionigeriensis TaxID=1805475 RepID=UPI00096B48BF|nr:DUF2225 domain-containing protein [Bacillus massilionigeriensis]